MEQMQPQNVIEKKEDTKMFNIEVLHQIDEKTMEKLLAIREVSFSKDWKEYEDAKEFYFSEISKPENISLALKKGEELMGFLLAMPHNVVQAELVVDDPEMPIDDHCFYIETMEIEPEIQKSLAGGKMFFRMLDLMIAQAKEKGVNRFTMHARVNTGLSLAVQRGFGKIIKEVRRIEQWKWNANEPSDYILGVIE
jgi:hypothetical protein